MSSVDRVRKQLSRLLDTDRGHSPRTEAERESALLRSVLAGWPDRVARRRRPRSPELVLSAGGSATLDQTSVVHDADLMVAVDAEERRGGVFVRIASRIDAEWLLELSDDQLGEVNALQWNESSKRVERVSKTTWGAVTLEETRQPAPPSDEASALLAEHALDADLSTFIETERLSAWQCRVETLRTGYPEKAFPVADEAFARQALTEACAGLRSFGELKEVDLVNVLNAKLTPAQSSLLIKETPERLTLPGGRGVKINYEPGKPPWIESRLQDFFGLLKGPAVGRTPLVLHLLAPNGNSVQVTTDLSGFWDRHYPAVRKELMRHYPRHSWPEDPRTAAPPPPRPPRPPRR
jgi:ATP-dependent helicase HrpB